MWFWKCLSIWTILSHYNCLCIFLELIVSYSFDIWKTDYFLNHLWYICQIKVCDLFSTYYFKTMKLLSYFWKPIVYYNFWRFILHLITLQIYYLIEFINTLVTYWVVNSLLFPLQFQIMKNNKFRSSDIMLWAEKEA